MAIKLMKKPYHITAKKADGTVAWKLSATPPARPGLAEDGKAAKSDNGHYIRVFTVTDPNDSGKAVGDKITLDHVSGEFPTGVEGDLILSVSEIEGIVAAKPRKVKTPDELAEEKETKEEAKALQADA